MRCIFLFVIILATLFQKAKAQTPAVTASAFNANITLLKQYVAQKNNAAAANVLTQLNNQMNAQMTYVKAAITAGQAAYATDIANENSWARVTAADSTLGQTELAQAGQYMKSNMATGLVELQKAENEIKAAANASSAYNTARQNAAQQSVIIALSQASLTTETNAYNTAQPIITQAKQKQTTNMASLYSALQAFASTLH